MSSGQDSGGDAPKPPQGEQGEQNSTGTSSSGHTEADLRARQQRLREMLIRLSDTPTNARMRKLAEETPDGRKRYSPDPSETEVPEKPIVHVAGKEVNFQDLFEQRPKGEDTYRGEVDIKDRRGQDIKVRITITAASVIIKPIGEYGGLDARVDENGEMNASLRLRSPITDEYLSDLPRGSEFLLAAYKFLAGPDLSGVKAFDGIWIGGGSIKDNYTAFEEARGDFLAETPEYAQWQSQVVPVESALKQIKDKGGDDYLFDDIAVAHLADVNWSNLTDEVKAIFHNNSKEFSDYQAIRRQMNPVEESANGRAIFETWTGKMMKIMGFSHAQLQARGQMVMTDATPKYEKPRIWVQFSKPTDSSPTQ